jgi:hypothetical protein
VLEIDADPRPRRKPAAHAIDQHVSGLKVGGDIGMPRFPSLQPLERICLMPGASDLDERVRWLTASRGLHARGFAGLFSIMRRPGGVAETLALLFRASASAARRTWSNVQRRSMRTLT